MDERLEIRTLGALSIARDGVLVEGFLTRKVEALLVYLACTGRPHSRQVLAEMLWEERTQGRALTNLRVALNNLRQTVMPYVVIARQTVAFDMASHYWLDVSDLAAQLAAVPEKLDAASARALEAALDLYRGDFLEGFFVESRQFEEWAKLERDHQQIQVVDAYSRLLAYYQDTHEYPAGIRIGTRMLQIDQLREETYRQLMHLLAASGQRQAAIARYRECCRVLADELAVEPSAETTALYQRIEADEIPVTPQPIRSDITDVPVASFVSRIDDVPGRSRPPESLLGREDLLAEVEGLLAQNARVLLQGFAGTGKTALASTIVAHFLQQHGTPVIWIEAGHRDAIGLLEALAHCLGDQSASYDVRQSGQQVGMLLKAAGVRLIVVDDAWNGDALDHLINAVPSDLPVLVTSRNRYPVLTHVGVPILRREASLTLLARHARTGWEAQTEATALCEVLGDLPFALRIAGEMLALDDLHPAELLQEIQAEPHLVQMPSGFEASQNNIPTLLRASIQALDDDTRDTFFAIGSLFAPGATSALVALLMQRDESQVRQSLRLLQRRGLAERDRQSDPRFAYYGVHDLAYSYARSEHQDWAALDACLSLVKDNRSNLELLHTERRNILGAARSAYLSGQRHLLIELMLLLTTGTQYLNTFGHTIAFVARVDEAIEAARALGESQAANLHYLLSKRGNIHYERGALDCAIACYEEAGFLARELGWNDRHILALCVTSKVRSEQGDALTAEAGLERAYQLAMQAEDDALFARVLENWSVHAFTQGDFEKTRALSQQEVTLAEQNDDRRSLFNGLYNWGSAEQQLGNFEASLPLLQRALEIAQTEDVIRWRAATLHLLAMAYLELGEYERAMAYCEESLAMFRQSGYTVKVRELEGWQQEIHHRIESQKGGNNRA